MLTKILCFCWFLTPMMTKILSFCWSWRWCWQRFCLFCWSLRRCRRRFCLFVNLEADFHKDFVFFVSGSSVHLIFWQGCPPVDEDCRRKPRKVRGVGSGIKNQFDTTERFKSSFCISFYSKTGTCRDWDLLCRNVSQKWIWYVASENGSTSLTNELWVKIKSR